jgi:hypothetical protein
LGGVCLAGREVEAVRFEEENADDKPRPLIAIDTGQRNLLASSRCATYS